MPLDGGVRIGARMCVPPASSSGLLLPFWMVEVSEDDLSRGSPGLGLALSALPIVVDADS